MKTLLGYISFFLICFSGLCQEEPVKLFELMAKNKLNIILPEYNVFIGQLNDAYEAGTIESEVEARDDALIGHRDTNVLYEDRHIIAITETQYNTFVHLVKRLFKSKYELDYGYNTGVDSCRMEFRVVIDENKVLTIPSLYVDHKFYEVTDETKCARWNFISPEPKDYNNTMMPWFTYIAVHDFKKEMLSVLFKMQ